MTATAIAAAATTAAAAAAAVQRSPSPPPPAFLSAMLCCASGAGAAAAVSRVLAAVAGAFDSYKFIDGLVELDALLAALDRATADPVLLRQMVRLCYVLCVMY